MALHLVTGYKGEPHITPLDQGAFQAGFMGTGEYVLDVGRKFEAQIMSNNIIRIFDGNLVMQGRNINLALGRYEDVNISNGTQSMNRNDIIVVRYTHETQSIYESAYLHVVEGTPTAGTATDPDLMRGDILSGLDLDHEMPLYRVKLEGLSIVAVEPLFKVLVSSDKVQQAVYRPNLLINGDFQCNQRGLNVYDYTSAGTHCLDMWHIWRMKLTVNEGYIKVENQDSTQHALNQTFGFSRKGTFTLVVKVKNVVGVDAHAYMVSSGTNTRIMNLVKGVNVATFTSDDFTKLCISIPANGSMELEYIDLFDGSFACPHVKEDYATALTRCMQYIQAYYISVMPFVKVWGSSRNNRLHYILPLTIPFKNEPTVQQYSFSKLYSDYTDETYDIELSNLNVSFAFGSARKMFRVDIAKKDSGKFESGKNYWMNSNSAIIVSCEPL